MDPTLPLACLTADDHVTYWGVGSFSLASAIITALLAPHRGRSAFWWFLIGGFLPWISILVLYLLADLSAPPESIPMAPAPGNPHEGGAWPGAGEPATALPQDGWFYAMRRQPMGPVSLQYLRGAIKAGSLSKNVPVWCSAFREWVSPTRVPGFFG